MPDYTVEISLLFIGWNDILGNKKKKKHKKQSFYLIWIYTKI